MTDNNQKPDIAQRIAEAIARTTKPRMSALSDFKSDEDTVIGEVPEHLQHLHNLLEEVDEEVAVVERRLRQAQTQREVIHTTFFAALELHVPSHGGDYDSIKLCKGWQVAGTKQGGDDGKIDGL